MWQRVRGNYVSVTTCSCWKGLHNNKLEVYMCSHMDTYEVMSGSCYTAEVTTPTVTLARWWDPETWSHKRGKWLSLNINHKRQYGETCLCYMKHDIVNTDIKKSYTVWICSIINCCRGKAIKNYTDSIMLVTFLERDWSLLGIFLRENL